MNARPFEDSRMGRSLFALIVIAGLIVVGFRFYSVMNGGAL
jgi:hypothetical protein